MSLADKCMLAALTRALDAGPFVDPVWIGDASLSRASARAAERRLKDALAAERRAA